MGMGKCVELPQPGTPIPESHSAVLQMILALPPAHLGDSNFFFESFRNVVFVENKMGNDGLKVDRDIRSNCEPA